MSSSTKSRPGSKGDEVRALPREGEAGGGKAGLRSGWRLGGSQRQAGEKLGKPGGGPRSLRSPRAKTLGQPRVPSFRLGTKSQVTCKGRGPSQFHLFPRSPSLPGPAPLPPGLGVGTRRGFQAPQREGRGIRAASPGFHLPRRLGGQRRGWRPIKSRNSGVRNRELGQRPPVSAQA